MSAVNSKNLQIFNAKQFKESVSEPSSSNLYFTIGRVRPWANDAAPPQANTSAISFYESWRSMIGGKRITGNDIRHCIPRIDWQSGVVYTMYDDTTDSKSFNVDDDGYYVMTDEYMVFKCLNNNRNSPSTVKPSFGTQTTADGYTWKYMYTIPASDRLRFLTDNFMPAIQSSAVAADAISGELSAIYIVDTGAGYSDNNLSVVITGDGVQANAYPVRNVFSNSIDSIIIDSKGKGYTFATAEIIADTATPANVASLKVIMSPPGGHGSDTLAELGASYLIVNPRLRGSEGDKLITVNDYRQISLIEDPEYYGTGQVSTNTVFKQVMGLTLTGISPSYQQDEFVYQGGSLSTATFSAVVVKWDSANSYLEVNNIVGTPTNDSLVGNTSTARRFVSSVTLPDFQPFSGRLLYKDNIVPIERADDQTDSFQIILKF